MGTFAGVGTSSHRDPLVAGPEAASAALAELSEKGVEPDLLLVFATSGYAPQPLIDGVRSAVSDVPLAGCTGEGIITQGGSDESLFSVAVMALGSSSLEFRVSHVTNLSDAPDVAAQTLASTVPDGEGLLLVLVDGLSACVPEFLTALDDALDDSTIVAGGTAGDAMKFEQTHQFVDGLAISDGVVAVHVAGYDDVEIAVSHGCVPIGLERVVTRAEGPLVLELDNMRAWDVFREYFDVDPSGEFTAESATFMSLARHTDAGLVVRSPLGLDADTGALFFVGGLEEGERVNMTHRTPDTIRDSAVETANAILEKHPGRRPSLVLQFDCAGRGRTLFGDRTTEVVIEPAQRVLGKDLPWIGMHTFGEVAQVGDHTYFHNYSVVLCALYTNDE